jgi:hypothetical protein
LGPLFVAVAGYYFYQQYRSSPIWLLSLFYSISPVALLPNLRVSLRQVENDIQELDFQIDLQEFHVNQSEGRRKKFSA